MMVVEWSEVRMSFLEEEYELAKKNYFLECDEDGLVLFTRDNVAKVEAMIRTDSKYRNAYDSTKGPSKTYNGSSAYWGKKLRQVLIEKKEKGNSFEEAIRSFVIAIDRENSTHLNSDGYGVERVTKRILSMKDHLVEYLKYPIKNHYQIIDWIAEDQNKTDDLENRHFSFATKFCHFACLYLFDGEERDNFSISDWVVKKALPRYIKKYLPQETDTSVDHWDYETFIGCIDRIREQLAKGKNQGEAISRNGFDHLIWYYHKGN